MVCQQKTRIFFIPKSFAKKREKEPEPKYRVVQKSSYRKFSTELIRTEKERKKEKVESGFFRNRAAVNEFKLLFRDSSFRRRRQRQRCRRQQRR